MGHDSSDDRVGYARDSACGRRLWYVGHRPSGFGERERGERHSPRLRVLTRDGLKKEGALHHGYTRVRGYHPLLAIAADSGEVRRYASAAPSGS
jgi:hypothetical protein